MRVGVRRGALLLAGMVLAVGGAMPGAQAVPAVRSSTPGWRLVKTLGCPGGFVRTITATGPRGAWAAGTTFCPNEEPLIARWNGRSWQQLRPPSRFATFGAFDVAALSSTYAWTFPGGKFALLWNNGRWRLYRLAHHVLEINSAVAFSPSDAWAFASGLTGPNAFRFDGKAWRQVPIPVHPQAAAAPQPRNIWAVGPLATGHPGYGSYGLAHWTGHWETIPFPNLHLSSGQFVYQAWVVSDNSGGAWVAADVGAPDFRFPVAGLLLRWTGRTWGQVKIPYQVQSIGPLAHDGHGGLWIATGPGSGVHLLHYSASKAWSSTALSRYVYAVNSLRLIPGTSSVWAGAQLYPADGPSALIFKYGR